MKWLPVILLAIVGVLAGIVAVEYLTVAIHALPSWIPGRHHGRGHYHTRGAAAALVALVAFGIAGYLAFRIVKADKSTGATQPAGAGAPVAPKSDVTE